MLKSVRPHGDYVNFVNYQLWHNLSQCLGARLNCIFTLSLLALPHKRARQPGAVSIHFIDRLSQVPKYCKENQMRFTHKRLTKTRKQKPISFDRLSERSNTISKSKCYSPSETRNELRYYEPPVLGLRISIT